MVPFQSVLGGMMVKSAWSQAGSRLGKHRWKKALFALVFGRKKK
jgi:hypothetical protein